MTQTILVPYGAALIAGLEGQAVYARREEDGTVFVHSYDYQGASVMLALPDTPEARAAAVDAAAGYWEHVPPAPGAIRQSSRHPGLCYWSCAR